MPANPMTWNSAKNLRVPFYSSEKKMKGIKSKVMETFEEFYDSNWYVSGKFTQSFEEKYARFSQVKHCVGVSSGLDALHLSLLALGIGKGDEVIVPSNTFIASVLAVTHAGAVPVFVEPRWATANLDPELIDKAITPKTKCIIPVHLYGQPCEMNDICRIAKLHGLSVLEDNAQSHGATYQGQLTGTFGQITAASFYPTKNLGALGEAGAVTTNDQSLAERVKELSNYGSEQKNLYGSLGFNDRMDEFEAAYLATTLDYLSHWNEARVKIANRYQEELADLSWIQPTQQIAEAEAVYHLFVVKTPARDRLQRHLLGKGIGTQAHYPLPPHLQVAYQHLNYRKGDFPIAEKLADTVLSLPLWPGISDEQISYVVESIKAFA